MAKLEHFIFPKVGGGSNPLVPPHFWKCGGTSPRCPPSPTPLRCLHRGLLYTLASLTSAIILISLNPLRWNSLLPKICHFQVFYPTFKCYTLCVILINLFHIPLKGKRFKATRLFLWILQPPFSTLFPFHPEKMASVYDWGFFECQYQCWYLLDSFEIPNGDVRSNDEYLCIKSVKYILFLHTGETFKKNFLKDPRKAVFSVSFLWPICISIGFVKVGYDTSQDSWSNRFLAINKTVFQYAWFKFSPWLHIYWFWRIWSLISLSYKGYRTLLYLFDVVKIEYIYLQ